MINHKQTRDCFIRNLFTSTTQAQCFIIKFFELCGQIPLIYLNPWRLSQSERHHLKSSASERHNINAQSAARHDDVIKWKHLPRYWPFVRGIHRSQVNSPHNGQWRGALMFSLICYHCLHIYCIQLWNARHRHCNSTRKTVHHTKRKFPPAIYNKIIYSSFPLIKNLIYLQTICLNISTPEGRAVSVTRELDLSLLCRIWLFGRHLVSLAKIAEVWPPFFLATETPDIALEYTSREIWSE